MHCRNRPRSCVIPRRTEIPAQRTKGNSILGFWLEKHLGAGRRRGGLAAAGTRSTPACVAGISHAHMGPASRMCAGGAVEQYGLVSPLILVNASLETLPGGILCTRHTRQTFSRLPPLETLLRGFCVVSNRIAFPSPPELRKPNALIKWGQTPGCL